MCTLMHCCFFLGLGIGVVYLCNTPSYYDLYTTYNVYIYSCPYPSPPETKAEPQRSPTWQGSNVNLPTMTSSIIRSNWRPVDSPFGPLTVTLQLQFPASFVMVSLIVRLTTSGPLLKVYLSPVSTSAPLLSLHLISGFGNPARFSPHTRVTEPFWRTAASEGLSTFSSNCGPTEWERKRKWES